ncbi:hypothetical protein Q7P37_006771 [Cladosporium fusiforme]
MAFLQFLPQTIHFSTGDSFERLESITDFRQCHGTIPPESRILYRCRRLASPSPSTPKPGITTRSSKLRTGDENENEKRIYILKIKVQIPDRNINGTAQTDPPPSGPSSTTRHETHALQIFHDARSPYGPNLIASETFSQPRSGLLPGGYISYTVMTLVPGRSLYELGYWSLAPEQRQEIQEEFIATLIRSSNTLPKTQRKNTRTNPACPMPSGLVDFEFWQAYSNNDEKTEKTEELLQQWGLAHKPPAKNWWAEFGIKTY